MFTSLIEGINTKRNIFVIDLVGITRDQICDALKGLSLDTATVITLCLDVRHPEGKPLKEYFFELERIVQTELSESHHNPSIGHLRTPPIIEELEVYRGSESNIFGSYPTKTLGWIRVEELIESISELCSNTTGLDGGDFIQESIAPTRELTVNEVLKKELRFSKPKYQFVPPQIFGEELARRGLDNGDSEIGNQLPYCQYFAGCLDN